MELFNERGCLTDEGLQALIDGELDELGRLEVAEHLAYCDRCIERYTALLSGGGIEKPQASVVGPVMKSLWVRIMQNTAGRAAVAGIAAVLALTLWGSGGLQSIVSRKVTVPAVPSAPRENVVVRMWDACDEFVSDLFDFQFRMPEMGGGKVSWTDRTAEGGTAK